MDSEVWEEFVREYSPYNLVSDSEITLWDPLNQACG